MRRLFLSILLVLVITDCSARFHKRRHTVNFANNAGVFGVETRLGFELGRYKSSVWMPDILVRYGVTDFLEVSCYTQILYEQSDADRFGFSVVQPSTKFVLNKQRGFVPRFAITYYMTLPKASTKDFKTDNNFFAPALCASAEQDITKKLSFEYAAGIAWDPSDLSRLYFTSLNAEYDIKNITLFNNVYFSQSNISEFRYDLGLNQSLTQNIQLELLAGVGVVKNTPSFFCTIGIFFSANTKRRVNRT